MDVSLVCIAADGAEELWKMQIEAFSGLLDQYQDFDTSPGNEPIEKVRKRLNQYFTYFYFIYMDGVKVGAIRIEDKKDIAQKKRISPIFVMPQYRNRGIAQQAIRLAEELHGSENWELGTILQEKGNCHLYEKMGYHLTEKREKVNDKLTLVFYEK